MGNKYNSRGSAMSQAHEALYLAQEKSGILKYEDAKLVLLNSPGFTFGEGRTSEDFLGELERWKFVSIDKNNGGVFVYKW